MSNVMNNNDNLLSARIEALKLTAAMLRKKLLAEGGITLKNTHSLELVACMYGFRDWQAAIAGLRS
ncbi:TPA_asm: hypothetical protein G1X19_11185 [Salmonella enterica subsp. enterica serovar Typhimurium str. SL1344]|uniref:Glyoxalase-related protein domain-containing protein n=1 Tax=Salmonella typhimurium (strain SL1344) TaxID=216597 RepID=A0A718RMB3_SALTS|nr:hypothetical protein [Salmonella enterica]EDU9586136.1 hypothetical protein [Salmonella enterica subsp. enterica serovar Kisangani]HAD6674490.1 hypothetical protein [Salmonella enterica subsp. enterica serovar Typhimurium str. SL1344]HAD6692754.1 hypothetical protein [Salmonella enterica subsp. enterica serovar Typhimurium str. SL1344]HAD6716203.1 hypothetical protein [Salmonella enterica subsp. enterica serovar Typhimurium str. SL1344]